MCQNVLKRFEIVTKCAKKKVPEAIMDARYALYSPPPLTLLALSGRDLIGVGERLS